MATSASAAGQVGIRFDYAYQVSTDVFVIVMKRLNPGHTSL